MRFLLVAFALTIAIASCVAQPQGQAKAAASSLNRVLDLGISSASDRHGYRSSRYRSRGRYGFGGCSGGGGGGNNNGGLGNISQLIEDLDNIVNLINNLIGQNGLLNGLGGGGGGAGDGLRNNAAGGFCVTGAMCASGTCTNNACT